MQNTNETEFEKEFEKIKNSKIELKPTKQKQGENNIFIDIYSYSIDIHDVIEKAKKHISIKKNNDKIDSLIVVSGDKFHKIK